MGLSIYVSPVTQRRLILNNSTSSSFAGVSRYIFANIDFFLSRKKCSVLHEAHTPKVSNINGSVIAENVTSTGFQYSRRYIVLDVSAAQSNNGILNSDETNIPGRKNMVTTAIHFMLEESCLDATASNLQSFAISCADSASFCATK